MLCSYLLFCWCEKTAINSISSNKTHVKYAFVKWVSYFWQVRHQAPGGRMPNPVPGSLPQYDVHRLQTGCDVGFGDLGGVRFQHMGLCGFHVWHWGCQPLPQAQEIVHAVRGKFPVLRKTTRVGSLFLISVHNTLVPCHLTQRIKAWEKKEDRFLWALFWAWQLI